MRLLLRCSVATIGICWTTAAAFLVYSSKISCVDGLVWNRNSQPQRRALPRSLGSPRMIGSGQQHQQTTLFTSPKESNRTEKDVHEQQLPPVANSIAGTTTATATHLQRRDAAVHAFELCANMALFSGLLDTIFYVTTPMFRPPRLADANVARELTQTIWKFGFAACFLYVAPIYQKIDVKNVNDDKVLASLIQTMAIFWRSTAGVLILTAGVDLVSSVTDRQRPWLVAVGSAFLAATATGVRAASTRQTNQLFRLNNDGTTTATTNEHRRLVRSAGHRAIRNMALCAAALLIKGCTSVVRFAMQHKEERKVFGLLGLPHPFVTSYFLLILRSKLLTAIAEITKPSSLKHDEKADATTMTNLYQAQTKFYSEVASIFKGEIRAKVVVVLVYILQPHLLPLVHSLKSAIFNFKRQ